MNSVSSDAVTLPISNQLAKLHIDEPKQNQLKVHSAYKRTDPSPHLSFLKAPTVSVSLNSKTNQSKNKSLGLTTKQLEATNKIPSKQKMLQESSSLSSLSSSTSVSSSNQKKQSTSKSDMRKSISSESSTSRKSGLPNPKVSIKPPTASLQAPQKSTTSPRVAPPKSPLQFQSNLIKPPTVSANSISGNQHKRRLFNPYVPSSTSLTATKASDTKNKPVDINNNVNGTISPKEKREPTGEASSTDKAHKFKMYNNKAGTNVSKINVIQAFKTSKMLQKPNAAQTKTIANNKTAPTETTKDKQTLGSSIYREKPSTGSDSLGGTFVKREDSAYCSSTSSTVSSQDVELGKVPAATEESTNLSRVKSTEISNQDEVETTENTTVETPTPTGSLDTVENTADIKPGNLETLITLYNESKSLNIKNYHGKLGKYYLF